MKEREKYGIYDRKKKKRKKNIRLSSLHTNQCSNYYCNKYEKLTFLFYVNIDMLTQNDNANVGPVCVCCKNWAQSAKPIQIFNEQFYITSLSFSQNLHVQYRTKEILKPIKQ